MHFQRTVTTVEYYYKYIYATEVLEITFNRPTPFLQQNDIFTASPQMVQTAGNSITNTIETCYGIASYQYFHIALPVFSYHFKGISISKGYTNTPKVIWKSLLADMEI